MTLGEKISLWRKQRKLTQEELAFKARVTKAAISNYENGYSSPSNDTLVAIADALIVSTDYLLGRTEDTTPGASKKPDNDDPIYIAYLGGPPEEMDEVEAQHLKRELEEFRRFREKRRKELEQQNNNR